MTRVSSLEMPDPGTGAGLAIVLIGSPPQVRFGHQWCAVRAAGLFAGLHGRASLHEHSKTAARGAKPADRREVHHKRVAVQGAGGTVSAKVGRPASLSERETRFGWAPRQSIS